MRSLTLKLVLAFLLTSVAGVALASLFIRRFVAEEFGSYVLAKQRATFIADAGTFYESTGAWDGLAGWLEQRQPQNDAKGRRRIEFVLLDQQGRVVLPGSGSARRTYSPDEIARGVPVTAGGQVVGTVLTPKGAVFRSADEERYLARTDQALAIAAGVMVAVALLLGVLLARLITRPVRELTSAAQSIAEGELHQQVPVRSRDELGLLALQFNQMSADLSRAVQLRRQMTADVAHDLRTPLTVLSGYLEALRDRVLTPTPERFNTLYSETQLLLRLVDDLHTLSLADAGELPLNRQRIAPRQLLERVAATHRHGAEQHGMTLQVATEPDLPAIEVDVEQLARALHNLVGNALRYTPAGGAILISARAAPAGVELVVADTGPGIEPEHLSGIFERFYRADPSRQQGSGGSGLGLAIVKSIVEAHGGRIAVESAPGRGASFVISLACG